MTPPTRNGVTGGSGNGGAPKTPPRMPPAKPFVARASMPSTLLGSKLTDWIVFCPISSRTSSL